MSLIIYRLGFRGLTWASHGSAGGGTPRFAQTVADLRNAGLRAVDAVRLEGHSIRQWFSAAAPTQQIESVIEELKVGSQNRLVIELDSNTAGHLATMPDPLKNFHGYLETTNTMAANLMKDVSKKPVPPLKNSTHKPARLSIELKPRDPKNFLFSVDLPADMALLFLTGAPKEAPPPAEDQAPPPPKDFTGDLNILSGAHDRLPRDVHACREAASRLHKALEQDELTIPKLRSALGENFLDRDDLHPDVYTAAATLLGRTAHHWRRAYLFFKQANGESKGIKDGARELIHGAKRPEMIWTDESRLLFMDLLPAMIGAREIIAKVPESLRKELAGMIWMVCAYPELDDREISELSTFLNPPRDLTLGDRLFSSLYGDRMDLAREYMSRLNQSDWDEKKLGSRLFYGTTILVVFLKELHRGALPVESWSTRYEKLMEICEASPRVGGPATIALGAALAMNIDVKGTPGMVGASPEHKIFDQLRPRFFSLIGSWVGSESFVKGSSNQEDRARDVLLRLTVAMAALSSSHDDFTSGKTRVYREDKDFVLARYSLCLWLAKRDGVAVIPDYCETLVRASASWDQMHEAVRRWLDKRDPKDDQTMLSKVIHGVLGTFDKTWPFFVGAVERDGVPMPPDSYRYDELPPREELRFNGEKFDRGMDHLMGGIFLGIGMATESSESPFKGL